MRLRHLAVHKYRENKQHVKFFFGATIGWSVAIAYFWLMVTYNLLTAIAWAGTLGALLLVAAGLTYVSSTVFAKHARKIILAARGIVLYVSIPALVATGLFAIGHILLGG